MSLVEKALKKMESARAQASAAPVPARRTGDAPPDIARSPATPTRNSVSEAAAALRDPLIPTIRTDKVVTINHNQLRSAGLLPSADEERRIAAEYRQIKRPLVAAALARGVPALPNGRVIMVASALPGEGKTFTCVNLALSLALERDTTTLLVDGDFAKAHLSRMLGVKDEPGLMDVLQDETRDIGSVILPTTVRGLNVLPAGRGADTATELLASTRMERIVADLLRSDPNRIVVFDSPPLLLTTESRALTGVAGQIAMVVRAEHTTQQAVSDALRFVGEGKPIGLILNHCRSAPTHGYYAYGEYGESADSRNGG